MKWERGSLISPPSYSGQSDIGPFIFLGSISARTTIDGIWDERGTWLATVESDPFDGLLCLRLRPGEPDLCIWRNHPNVSKVSATDKYTQALITVRLVDFASAADVARVKMEHDVRRLDAVAAFLNAVAGAR